MWQQQEIERFLKQRVCQNDGDQCMIFYGVLYELIGINDEDISQRNHVHHLLGEISTNEVLQGRPMLSAIVVTRDDFMAGKGFVDLAQRLLPEMYIGKSREAVCINEFNRVKGAKSFYCEQLTIE